MKINDSCLPCLVNQVIKVADITHAENREALYKEVFAYLSTLTFTETNPEIVGATFELLKKHIGNEDPYKEIRAYYNTLFLKMQDIFSDKIASKEDPFLTALTYAILGNIIDFNPIHNSSMDTILETFENIDNLTLTVNHVQQLTQDILHGKRLLYLGDNCGEICLDKLLLREIKRKNPSLEIYFGVRGTPVVNDSIEADAYFVGINEYATIISNGDRSLGTVLSRTSREFNAIYNSADIIIAKGQANYESLSEDTQKNIYFLLVTKCEIIARDIGIPTQALVCLNKNKLRQA